MRPSQVSIAIENCIAINRPIMITGPSGVGKSDVVRQAVLRIRAARISAAGLTDAAAAAAQAMPLDCGTHFGLIDFRAALRDAVDIMGLPGAINGQTFYNKPAGLPGPGWNGIVFLDEINSAPQQTQAALYQLTLDRAVGDYRLPDGAFIVAAGNRLNDRGVVHRMPDPLANRFVHVDYEVDLGDWCAWALDNGIRPDVIAYYRFRKEHLHLHDPNRQGAAFGTPRSAATVSKIRDLKSPIENELIRGTVGDAIAGEQIAFFKLFDQMVSPDHVLLNPTSADVPANSSILYALAIALAKRATPKNFDAILSYAARMPAEYSQALVTEATRANPALCNTHEYIRWASKQAA